MDGFSGSHIWMWELDYKGSWVPKNWCFWTVVLEKTLESPLDSMEIQPVHPKGNPKYSLEGLMLKLKLQYFGYLMQRTDSLEKTLMLGKIEGGRRRGQQRMKWWMASPKWWTWVWVGSRSWWWTGKPGMLQSMGSQRVGHDWTIELNWSRCAQCNYKDLWKWKRETEDRQRKKSDNGKRAREVLCEKHLFLLYWLCQSLWLCGSQ